MAPLSVQDLDSRRTSAKFSQLSPLRDTLTLLRPLEVVEVEGKMSFSGRRLKARFANTRRDGQCAIAIFPIVMLAALIVINAGAAQASHVVQTFADVTLSGGRAGWTVLDALPSGEDFDSSDRTVHLTFDIAFLGPFPTAAPLRIIANGMTALDTSFARSGTQAYPGVIGEDLFPAGTGSLDGFGREYSLDLTFPLIADPGCCTDIVVVVDQPNYSGASPMTLSSVRLDWSQPIPEPGTATLVAIGLVILARRPPAVRI